MKTLYFIILCLTLLLFTQCKKCINREMEESELNNISIEKVIKKLGKETSITEFNLTYDMTGHRNALLSVAVVNELDGEPIKEYTWKTSECRRTYVWFRNIDGSWTSVSNLTYNPQK